jgi:hypothetical protein
MQVASRHKGEECPKLGKDVIEMFMSMAMKYALAYELTEADMDFSEMEATQQRRDWKRNQFKGWARLAVAWDRRSRAVSKPNVPRDLDLASDRERQGRSRHHGIALIGSGEATIALTRCIARIIRPGTA